MGELCQPRTGRAPAGSLAAVDHVLTTERLVLRPVTAQDHAALLTLWTAPEVRRFLFDGAVLSPAEITGVIEDSARDFAVAGYGLWLIREGDGTGVVGAAGLRPLEDLGLEVFYSLAPGAWGRGFATEAARADQGASRGRRGQRRVGRGAQAARHDPVRGGAGPARPHDPLPHGALNPHSPASREPWSAGAGARSALTWRTSSTSRARVSRRAAWSPSSLACRVVMPASR